ncbi:hypothetical protein [uncultured Flavonifractor sp.]|uniref:hypothetical protein n=1 Tax=uncultured Flavonifractor sp. TaxID=1193534 RepID=UPI0026150D57|nr:hypothetical protein [uncultured Flavonifractor sp.]
MTELLVQIGEMSLAAGLTALAVIALRWVLVRLKAPAFVLLLLWAAVLFRMVCPVSFASPWSAAALVEEALPRRSGRKSHLSRRSSRVRRESQPSPRGSPCRRIRRRRSPPWSPRRCRNPGPPPCCPWPCCGWRGWFCCGAGGCTPTSG